MEAASDAVDTNKYMKYLLRLESLNVKMYTAIAKAKKASYLSLAVVLNRLDKKKEKKTRYPKEATCEGPKVSATKKPCLNWTKSPEWMNKAKPGGKLGNHNCCRDPT